MLSINVIFFVVKNRPQIGSNDHALGSAVVPSASSALCLGTFGFSAMAFFSLQDHVTPAAFGIATVSTHACVELLHPAILIRGGVGIEIYDFTIVESDSESFLDEHIALLFFSKAGPTTLSALRACLFLSQSSTIINQFARIGKIDSCTWLASRFMISSQLASLKLEETATPVLRIISDSDNNRTFRTYRTIASLLTQVTLVITSR